MCDRACVCMCKACCGDRPSSWLAEVVVRLNCCSRYFPRKAAKPATTAISMQAARMMQVNTGFDRRCLVTLGITGHKKERKKLERKTVNISVLVSRTDKILLSPLCLF